MLNICVISCSKPIDPTVCIDNHCIDGEWEWVESYGPKAGLTVTPQSSNQTKRLLITETHYQEYVNDSLIVDLEYEFIKSNELATFTADSLILKLMDGNWLAPIFDNDTLMLREPCFDCWDHTYVRK